MGVSVWARRPAVPVPPEEQATWQAHPVGAAALAGLRRGIRAAVAGHVLPPGSDGGERLLLVVEELASNALRHGRSPVRVAVTAASLCWRVAVSDGAPDRPPVPAVDRDPAEGGMGLALVARLCAGHGWAVEEHGKTVWAQLPYVERPTAERVRQAVEAARVQAARLAGVAERTAESLDGLAAGAEAAGRATAAGDYRSGAARARLEAERARWVALTAVRPTAGRPPGRPPGRVAG